MKFLLIGLAVLVIAFIIIQIYAMSSQNNIETYEYEVVKKYDDFEIRRYEPSLFTSVRLSSGSYKDNSSRGFSALANYIFGGNERNEKIAMTSPVSMSVEDSMTMMFMVPKKYNKETLPEPNQKNIEIKEVPERLMASITFGGWANDDKIAHYREKLINYLEEADIEHIGKFYFFGYNPPYEVFNRKNEVLVELPDSVELNP